MIDERIALITKILVSDVFLIKNKIMAIKILIKKAIGTKTIIAIAMLGPRF